MSTAPGDGRTTLSREIASKEIAASRMAAEVPKTGSRQRRIPSHQEIAELAYSYWDKGGRRGGSALEDWLRAERELFGRA
ncbi:MAG TPA: DUF2934 domain-containing protein [Bryobacteraceae bacterium]